MRVDWDTYRPRITVTGLSAWPEGRREGWCGTVAEHSLLLFTAGNGQFRVSDGRTLPLGAGTCLWLIPGLIYEGVQVPEQPLRNGYIHFDLINRSGARRPYNQPIPPTLLDNIDVPAVESTFRRITTLLPYFVIDHRDRFPAERIAVAEALLHGLLMDVDLATEHRLAEEGFGVQRHHSETIMRLLAGLEEHPDAHHTVQSLADEAGYSAAHFSRVFRAVIGQWPEPFLIHRRIKRAEVLLTTTAMSVGEIAERLGYRRSNFFSTQFRQKIGCSPGAFRARRAAARSG